MSLEPGLARLGWDERFAEEFTRLAADRAVPARVVADFGAEYLVDAGDGPVRATARRCDPAVGDWVALRDGAIAGIVHRRAAFTRRAPGAENRQQVLAANVDFAFVVAAATDVNVRRIERYLTIAWQSGAVPIVLLTKADLADDVDAMRRELESVASGTDVLVTSGVSGEGIDAIAGMLRPARTGVLLGPSGAGKSTLINRLAGAEVMPTREIHRSGEGRHMTSHRRMIILPAGGMIVDTPGLREAQLWSGEEALGDAFGDVDDLALRCRFNDCAHGSEPGCAVQGAIASGALTEARLASYRKLQRELRAIAARSDARLREDERRKWKRIAMATRARTRP